jgi:hypothetical protein
MCDVTAGEAAAEDEGAAERVPISHPRNIT